MVLRQGGHHAKPETCLSNAHSKSRNPNTFWVLMTSYDKIQLLQVYPVVLQTPTNQFGLGCKHRLQINTLRARAALVPQRSPNRKEIRCDEFVKLEKLRIIVADVHNGLAEQYST